MGRPGSHSSDGCSDTNRHGLGSAVRERRRNTADRQVRTHKRRATFMHLTRRHAFATIVAMVSFSASTIHAADSCGGGCPTPPTNSRSVSAVVPMLPSSLTAILSAGLSKGKKKRVLHVEAMMTSGLNPFGAAANLAM